MRWLAILAGFGAALALGYAGGTALLLGTAPAAAPEAGPAEAALARDGTAPGATTAAGPWPLAFGEYREPPPEPEPEPEPPPEAPPIVNPNFTLRGIYVGADGPWAIVAYAGDEYLLRLGDRFQDYATVVEIGPDEVWLDTGTGREMIGFE